MGLLVIGPGAHDHALGAGGGGAVHAGALQKEHVLARLGRFNGRRKACHARADHDDLRILLDGLGRALLDQIRSIKTHRLRIGVFDMSQMMARVCERFSADYPQVAQEYIMVSPEAWMEELEKLRTGQMDILEHTDVPQVHENDLDFVPLMRDQFICAVHASHPLAKKDIIEPEDLAHLRIGIHDIACVPGFQALLDERAPGSELISGDKGPLSAFDVCKGGGVFLSSRSFSEKYRHLRTLPFRCDLVWTYGLVFKRNPDPLVQLFIDSARAQFPA